MKEENEQIFDVQAAQAKHFERWVADARHAQESTQLHNRIKFEQDVALQRSAEVNETNIYYNSSIQASYSQLASLEKLNPFTRILNAKAIKEQKQALEENIENAAQRREERIGQIESKYNEEIRNFRREQERQNQELERTISNAKAQHKIPDGYDYTAALASMKRNETTNEFNFAADPKKQEKHSQVRQNTPDL